MRLIEALRQARLNEDITLIKILCRRLGFVLRDFGKHGSMCPHCDRLGTGLGYWPDDMTDTQWYSAVHHPFTAYVYRCGTDDVDDDGHVWLIGCGNLFLRILDSNNLTVQANPTA